MATKQETIQEVNSSIFASFKPQSQMKISEVESRNETESPSRVNSPFISQPQSPMMKPIEEGKRQTITLVRYIDIDEAKAKLMKWLFNAKASIDSDILHDEKIFRMIEDGLNPKEITWIREK